MDMLLPCFDTKASVADKKLCDVVPLSLEIEDIVSFRAFLETEEASKYPFATTVALHNIVTSTIPATHWRGYPRNVDRKRFFCVDEAAELISMEIRGPVTVGYPGVPRLPAGIRLPGISEHHRLVSCPHLA